MENTRKFYGDAFIRFEDSEDNDIVEPFKLEYYQIEDINCSEKTPEFGIEIIKKKIDDEVILDKESFKNITSTQKDVSNILNILQKNKVSPIIAGDVIEDLMKDNIYRCTEDMYKYIK
jgi:hypothetical protein